MRFGFLKNRADDAKECVGQFLVRLAWRRPHVHPLLLQGTGVLLPVVQRLNGRERFRAFDEALLLLEVHLQVVVLEFLVNVDVVEELVLQAVVLVMHVLVLVTGYVTHFAPRFAHFVEHGECSTNVLFFLDGVTEAFEHRLFLLQVGTLLVSHLLAPGLFALLESGYCCFKRFFFRGWLVFENRVRVIGCRGPSLALFSHFFCRQGTELLDGFAHVHADALQVLLGKQFLNTGQDL